MSTVANLGFVGGPLDDRLRLLAVNPWDADSAPLAVRRFVREFETNSPSEAMKLATDALLSAYQSSADKLAVPVVVERLCQLCGATLSGARPKPRTVTAYSVDTWQPRSGHTGKLYLEGSRAEIRIPEELDYQTARVSVAHEIGHLLIHRRGTSYDAATMRLGSSDEEEALAEYAARLLLMPSSFWSPVLDETNLAEYAITQASLMRVTVHSAVMRFGDPDVVSPRVQGAILWRINPNIPPSESIHARLTPHWHLCPSAFVPIRRCKARAGSLIAELAAVEAASVGCKVEDVRIGSFAGRFRVDAFSWGSVQDGTRLVLSVFRRD